MRSIAAFCHAIGQPQLGADARYAQSAARTRNRDSLVPVLAATLATRTVAEWILLLEPRNVPCGPVNDMRQVFEDRQVRHRELRRSLPHASAGSVPVVASPIRLSATPIRYTRAAPTLGEHNDEILTERLGLTAERIAALRSGRVV